MSALQFCGEFKWVLTATAVVKIATCEVRVLHHNLTTECMSVWLDGLLWEQEAVGSNPTIPTIFAERGANLASTHNLKCCTALTDCEN